MNRGVLGMLNLYDWWFSDITQEERLTIQTNLDNNPLGISYNSLIIGDDSDELDTFVNGEPLGNVSFDTLLNGELTYAPAKKRQVHLLTLISNYLSINKDSTLIIKLLNKAESFSDSSSFIDRHFLYSNLIKNYSKQSDSKSYEFYLLKMISISKQTAQEFKNEYKDSPLPGSLGIDGWYKHLIKNQRVEEALNFLTEVDAQGWRIEHLKEDAAKIAKTLNLNFVSLKIIEKYSKAELDRCPQEIIIKYFYQEIENDIVNGVSIDKNVEMINAYLLKSLVPYPTIEAYLYIGRIYLQLGELTKAKQNFERIFNLKDWLSSNTIAIFCKNIGNIYFEINDFPEALIWYKHGLKLNPLLSVKKQISQLEK
jgi:tetratricopeptide (TPR) repeat protein